MLARYSVRSASTIPVGTSTLLTGNSAIATQSRPNVTTGAVRRAASAPTSGRREDEEQPSVCAVPQRSVAPLISCGE